MPEIVIIEDDETIIELMQEALAAAGVAASWRIARDGSAGMDWAGRVGHDLPLPALLILDLNLPSYSGMEILARIRSRPELAAVPVVVMSGSLDPKHRANALAGGATMFLGKPYDIAGFHAHGLALKALIAP